MKKVLFTALLMTFAGGAYATVGTAAAPTAYTIADDTTAAGIGQPEVFTYTAVAARAGYVKNDFDFTMSAWSIGRAIESADVRQMSVGVVSARGRGHFTGNSDGGSVSQCGDLLPAADAKDTANLVALLDQTSTDVAANSGCVPAP